MAGLTREQYEEAAREIRTQWERVGTQEARDACLRVLVELGRKYGYKNVIAALQNRVPKQFDREKSLTSWLDEQRREETDE